MERPAQVHRPGSLKGLDNGLARSSTDHARWGKPTTRVDHGNNGNIAVTEISSLHSLETVAESSTRGKT